MSSQSWAAWLLDSYASSVSHLPSDGQHTPQPSVDTTSFPFRNTEAPPSNSSSLNPHTPFVRTGRGGAGNFHWDEPGPSNQEHDTEAQKPSTLGERRKASAKLERLQIGDVMAKRVSSAPFMHTGRGGAGNYTQSNEIQSAKSPRSASAMYASSASSTPTTAFGRGGAGNLSAREDAKLKAQRESEEREREEAERRRGLIEQQVEGFLRPPPGAVLATASRRSSMMLEGG